MSLTVEIRGDSKEALDVSEVAIAFDDEGLEYLIRTLEFLRGRTEHLHLMTPAWGGEELTEADVPGTDYAGVNHLRIVHY